MKISAKTRREAIILLLQFSDNYENDSLPDELYNYYSDVSCLALEAVRKIPVAFTLPNAMLEAASLIRDGWYPGDDIISLSDGKMIA